MSRLITSSLFGAVNWFMNSPPSWKERATKDLHNQLARVWTGANAAMQRGMDFEKAVYNMSAKDPANWTGSEFFKDVVRVVKGGIFQAKAKRFIEVAGEEYCLYGKIDVKFPMKIMDIKTTGNYKGKNKYLDSMQHKIYCFCESITVFEYVVAEFDGDSNTIKDIHTVVYNVHNPESIKEELEDRITSLMTFLENDPKLMELYLTKFSRY